MAGETPSESYIQGLWAKFKERAAGIGETVGAGYNTKSLTEDEEDTIWNNRALSVEQEWDLWRQGMTPEEIGLKVFPAREELVKTGGRIEPKAWYAKVNTMAQRAERKRMQQADPMQMLEGGNLDGVV